MATNKFAKKESYKTTAQIAGAKVAANAPKYKKLAAVEDKKAASAKKVEAKSAPKAKKESTPKQEDNRKIKVLVKDNPKRQGSAAHKTYELYRNSKTVKDFLASGGSTADLRYDEAKQYIELA